MAPEIAVSAHIRGHCDRLVITSHPRPRPYQANNWGKIGGWEDYFPLIFSQGEDGNPKTGSGPGISSLGCAGSFQRWHCGILPWLSAYIDVTLW